MDVMDVTSQLPTGTSVYQHLLSLHKLLHVFEWLYDWLRQ